ncbi:MAG: ABC transporter substrate binding protein [Clostridiales bacterium]
MYKTNLSKNLLVMFLILILAASSITSCSSGNKEETITENKKVENTSNESSDEDTDKKDSEITADLSDKKVAIYVEMNDPELKKSLKSSIETYKSIGIKEEQITIYNSEEDLKYPSKVLEKVNALKPDVLQIIPGLPLGLRKDMIGSEIPVAVAIVAEISCDKNGLPTENIFGIRSYAKDMPGKLYNILNTVAPPNGKKAGYIHMSKEKSIAPEIVEPFLNDLDIELKEFIEVDDYEDSIAASEKLQNDDEIDWVLFGSLPHSMKDGSPANYEELLQKVNKIIKKPTGAFFDRYVASGALCGATIDVKEVFGAQAAEMATELLKGKDIKELKIQDPKKVHIVFNKQTADNLNIEIPEDLFTSAYRIYTDNKNNYIGKN